MSFLYNTPDYDKLPPVTPMHIILLRERISAKQQLAAEYYNDAFETFNYLPYRSETDREWTALQINYARDLARTYAEDAMSLMSELMAAEADEAAYRQYEVGC